ncbi:MAG TPA: cyclomaltodextrinase N-terminal domain-containing protein, partial [Chitinophagaceae bacterium]|nr:cyclomaltodextrinase N-terminal domain-containing protein [Chitinophagaceae bacterium]
MKKTLTIIICICLFNFVSAQDNVEVYPSHWWVGMKNKKLQLMLHEPDATKILAVDKLVVKSSSPDLKIVKVNKIDNRRYLLLDVMLHPNAKAQTVTISFGGIVPSEWRKVSFELKPRRAGKGTRFAQGISSSDFVYLLMPDRFANGDASN